MESEILEKIRCKVATELSRDELSTLDSDNCTAFDMFVASSGLQKSIRRGDVTSAVRCMLRLITDDPARFWRRLVNIAFEDIGIADCDVIGRVVAATGNSTWRRGIGGDTLVAAHLVNCMCNAVKDRTADDLIVLCERHPRLTNQRRAFSEAPISQLLDAVANSTSLEEAALASWFAVGTRRLRSNHLLDRIGDGDCFWRFVQEIAPNDEIVEVAKFGMMRGGSVLAAFLPLVQARSCGTQFTALQCPNPEGADLKLGDLPIAVFDRYTAIGKAAIARFLSEEGHWKDFLHAYVAPRQRFAATADALFRVDGGFLRQRLSWSEGDRIFDESNRQISGIPALHCATALEVLYSELPRINLIRLELGQ